MNNRPKIQIPRSKVELLLDIFSIMLLFLAVAYCIVSWSELPQQVPIHFDSSGNPDGWGNKMVFSLLPLLGIILYISLALLRKIPHLFNYPVPITNQNAEQMYRLSLHLLGWIRFEISLLFSTILWNVIEAAKGHRAEQFDWIYLVILLSIFGTIIYYLVRIVKK